MHIGRPTPETPSERRERHLDYFRRAADAAMRAIEIASEQLDAAHATGEPGATASPTLDLARATRALVTAVAAENRTVADQAVRRVPADDRRRVLLREELHKIARNEPDPKRRGILYRDVDERIEEVLLADPDAETAIECHLVAIADEFHLVIDPAKLSDEILGIVSTATREPAIHSAPSGPDLWDDG